MGVATLMLECLRCLAVLRANAGQATDQLTVTVDGR